MWAAASGHSTLGIPQAIGKEFIGKDSANRAAGVCLMAEDGQALFLKRGADSDHAGTWCFPGGGAEDGEAPHETARRELREECGASPYGDMEHMHHAQDDASEFVTFKQPVKHKFTPKLNDEHTEHQWASLDNPPEPLHPGVRMALDELACDAEFKEGDHPRAENGQFGSGGGSEGNALSNYDLDKLNKVEDRKKRVSAVRNASEEFANKAKELGFSVNVEHSGSVVGPSSYVTINGIDKPFRFSDHSKGAKKFSEVNSILDGKHAEQMIAELSDIAKKRKEKESSPEYQKYLTESKEKANENEEKLHQIRLKNAAKKLAKGKELTNSEKEAVEIEKNKKQASDSRLAFDRATVRTVDQDGRLHIEITNISKATVNPYLGSEIPNGEELGLDPKKIYQLLRDPEELKKAAPTFNNIQVLSNVLVPEKPEHVPVNVEDHQPMMTVGSTGTDAEFVAPYLRNSMVIWVAEAIRKIENNEQREISCAYRYTADMTPGKYEGSPYDGVMREIFGNHISIVEVGRAGADVIVGDSKLKEVIDMSKKPLSRKAVLAKGALMAFLQPAKLAQDAKVNLDAVLSGVAADNFGKMKAGIAAAIKPKLAKDADLADLVKLLDTLDGEKQENVVGDEFPEAKKEEEKKVAEDEANPHEQLLTFLRGKISDEDLKSVEDMLMGEEEEEKEEGLEGATDTPPEFEGKPANPAEKKPEVSKAAMDAAIKSAVAQAEKSTMERMRSIKEAESVVRPYVGDIVAQDSAEGVYKAALGILGVDVADVPPSAAAYRAILQAQPKPGSQPRIAKDSAMSGDLLKDFPNATRLK